MTLPQSCRKEENKTHGGPWNAYMESLAESWCITVAAGVVETLELGWAVRFFSPCNACDPRVGNKACVEATGDYDTVRSRTKAEWGRQK